MASLFLFEDMKTPNPLRVNIIAGIPALIDSAIKTATGRPEPFRSLTIARELSKPEAAPDLDLLVENLWTRLQSNWERAGSECRSESNWRWESIPYIHPTNRSPEKRLEKALAAVLPESEWVNQVPTASGLSASGDSHRNIDLAHWDRADVVTIVELKAIRQGKGGSFTCDTPIHAAFEIVVNALLLCLAREKEQIRKKVAEKDPWLRENLTAHLRVLGPREFYRGEQLELSRFEQALNRAVTRFGAKHGLNMTFAFSVFDLADALLESLANARAYQH